LTSRSPILLTSANFYGTLAAVRCLGREGIPVTVADPRRLAPALWSRYVSQRVRCPPLDRPAEFIDWLLDFGRRQPGHVLCASSDDMAWLIARHRDELQRDFLLDSPPPGVIAELLDKERLHQNCRRAEIAVPETWFPSSQSEIDGLASTLPYPILIKPRTQVFLRGHAKGDRIARAEDLAGHYRDFEAQNPYLPAYPFEGLAGHPMLQAYRVEAAQGIYNLAGFVSEQGECVVRASNKLLQRPRRLGIGLCFEAAEVRADLSASVVRLCQQVGYHGVFEVEFIRTASGRHLLIDFNPRFYSQMAFEIARGLPLPLLAYEASSGDRVGLRAAIERSSGMEPEGTPIYCHRSLLALLVASQVMSGRMTSDEARSWAGWYHSHRSSRVDAVLDQADRIPALVDLALHGWHIARHPRYFVRSTILDE
jgi:D-aspartate ligase